MRLLYLEHWTRRLSEIHTAPTSPCGVGHPALDRAVGRSTLAAAVEEGGRGRRERVGAVSGPAVLDRAQRRKHSGVGSRADDGATPDEVCGHACPSADSRRECGDCADDCVSSKASVAAAPHARSLCHECKRQRGGRASSDRYRVCDRHVAAGRVLGRPAFGRAYGARHAPRIRRDGRADLTYAGCRSRACPGRGILGCVRLSRMAPRHRDTPPNGSHGTPLGLAAAKLLLSASSVYAFSDHGLSVATFED